MDFTRYNDEVKSSVPLRVYGDEERWRAPLQPYNVSRESVIGNSDAKSSFGTGAWSLHDETRCQHTGKTTIVCISGMTATGYRS